MPFSKFANIHKETFGLNWESVMSLIKISGFRTLNTRKQHRFLTKEQTSILHLLQTSFKLDSLEKVLLPVDFFVKAFLLIRLS